MLRIRFAAVASLLLIFAAPAFAQDHQLPDHSKTPGATLKAVPDAKAAACLTKLMGDKVSVGDPITQEMICRPAYSPCIRSVSQATKKAVYTDYGIPDGPRHGYCDIEQGCEVDHLISIEIGGSNDRKNLWPQPYSGLAFNAHAKDRLENWYHSNVCSGHVSLATAQKEISSDWVAAFKKRIGPEPDSE
jgi:hypothetical protein